MVQGVFLIKRLMLLCSAGCFALFLNGCAETTQFEDVWESSLKDCSTNCHSPDGANNLHLGPDMSTQDKFYANVVGKTIGNDYAAWTNVRTGTCDDVQLIEKGDAANSLVVASLVQDVADALAASENCTVAINIHDDGTKASADNWAALIKWINDGAPKE